jgi:hypothetical protein
METTITFLKEIHVFLIAEISQFSSSPFVSNLLDGPKLIWTVDFLFDGFSQIYGLLKSN